MSSRELIAEPEPGQDRSDLAILAEGIRANREVCERYAYLSPSIATALNPVIRYSRAAEVVKKSLKTGKTIPEVCLEDKVLSEKELKEILDPHRMTEPGLPPTRRK